MNQLRMGIVITLLIIFQIVLLLLQNNNSSHILALSSHNQKSTVLSSVTIGSSQPNMHNNHEHIKKFTLIADDKNIVKISPDNTLHPGGVLYKAMTYNNTIPGPAIVVNQGDIFQITVYNKVELVRLSRNH